MSVAPIARPDLEDGLRALESALESLSRAAADPDNLADTMTRLERCRCQLNATRLRLLAEARRYGVPERTGSPDAGSWLAGLTHADPAVSARDARLGDDLAEVAHQTREALTRGAFSTDHAAVIAAALNRLPDACTPEQVAEVERHLVKQAERLSPGQLRRVARRAIEVIENDPQIVDATQEAQLETEEERAYRLARLTLHDNGDGTTTGRFVVPTLHASALRKVLDAITAPRRAHLGASIAHAGDIRHDDPERGAKLRGLAFCEIVEHLPTDHLSSTVNATLLVTIDHERLAGASGAAGLDVGEDISAGEARRLACGAGILPAVLNGPSQPLDLGRRTRLFTESQRAALSLRHETCAADGCLRPFAWCEIHHRQPWAAGGKSDLDNAVPLCWFHHRRIHDFGYRHEWSHDGVRFSRRT